MLEGWTTLGYLAANTQRARLGLMVGGVHYRLPGLWVKAATTLDVLSGGRAWLGIGAAWNEEESRSLGFPFPALGERFEMLEETLQTPPDGGRRGTNPSTAATPGVAAHELAAVDLAAASRCDRRRRQRKTLRSSPVRRRDERLRRPGADPPQVRGPPRALRRSDGA